MPEPGLERSLAPGLPAGYWEALASLRAFSPLLHAGSAATLPP